ncbi:hypothetical protein CL655_00330 [bacterium]|nr:hypothetical protein [bacterium]|tara:strand:- start:1428 stop:2120 length:693 start_codon:yes stop_codon:yes gene_type:complete
MRTAQSFIELYEQLKIRFIPFFVAFFVVVFVTYFVLYLVDFYPEPVTNEVEEATVTAEATAPAPAANESQNTFAVTEAEPVSPLPVEITFDALDRTVAVLNPAASDYSTLDNALLSGAVRHPESADLVNTGNMLILGHSSYLPNVLNKNFQAFNGIEKLNWGDTVRVISDDTEYVYRVDRVYFAPASDIFIPVGEDETPKLTLVTCKVLGAKEDRYILEASLVNTVALAG